ncbi:hypothetical protein GUJ93_ZPchr0001g30026 [Zizania palustris]|uniref:Spt20-like SEP domain-containing protein n=1 Tax=Zizania palustris TaxID=103762 RepID=A0A8J5RNZ2_ZIZPA|nr:hypothetical protein GUJ93_ZPchr0001g30026 [Zizania palustris]
MVVSFRVSRRGRRFYPPPPPPPPPPPNPAAATADIVARPSDGSPLPQPLPWDDGAAARSVSDMNGAGPDDLELEPSFALNLFPDGYSIGDPGKGMLLFLIGDDPEKRPYSRASKALISDIEHGYLPQDILSVVPCKFVNGTIVCEVRDYRSFLSNGGDSSGYDFPKVNRVSLRLGTECVVKDLSSMVDASWTYHDQLVAESVILSALQPRLNLDPAPCLERLYNSVVKTIDLGLNNGRQQIKATSVVSISAYPPENCQLKELISCEGAVVCIENAASEGLNGLSINHPSSLQTSKAKLAVGSHPDNGIRYSSTLMNSSAVCDGKQSTSDTPAPDLLLQSHEQWAQVAVLKVDNENGGPQRETVLLQNRKEHSNRPREIHEWSNCRPSNIYSMFRYENSKCHFQTSVRTSNNERFNLGSPKEQPVKVELDQTTGINDTRVHQQRTLSVLTANRPLPSSNTNNSCIETISEEVDSSTVKLKDRNLASTVDLNNYGVAELKGRRTRSVTSCSASSRKAPCKPPKAATEPQSTSSKRKVLGNSTSSNQEIDSKGKRQKKADTQINTPPEDGSSEEPYVIGGINHQLGVSPDIELCIGDPSDTTEPDIVKILSEVILTSQRHGLDGRAAKIDGLERSWPLPPSKFFPSENTDEMKYTQNEIMSFYPSGRTMNSRKIKRLSFHPIQYFCRGTVDEFHYTLCLLESEAPDDHQIAVEMIYGDERIYISTLPTSMKRDGYTLCNDMREQYEDAPQLCYLSGDPQYQWLLSPIARSVVIDESKNIGHIFHNRPPHVHANPQWLPTQQCPTLASVQAYLWNPNHPGLQHYTSRVIDQVQPSANVVFPMDLGQYLSCHQRQAVEQCLQCRPDIAGFNGRHVSNASTGSYNQWRQVSTELGGKVYQWDLPVFDKHVSCCPPLHAANSTLSPALDPGLASPPSFASDDGSVTSIPAQFPVPLGYQCLPHGMC